MIAGHLVQSEGAGIGSSIFTGNSSILIATELQVALAGVECQGNSVITGTTEREHAIIADNIPCILFGSQAVGIATLGCQISTVSVLHGDTSVGDGQSPDGLSIGNPSAIDHAQVSAIVTDDQIITAGQFIQGSDLSLVLISESHSCEGNDHRQAQNDAEDLCELLHYSSS